MKKILGLIIFALAYVGLTYYSGVVGEQYINEQVELTRKQNANANIDVELNNYQRGIFKSTFNVTMQAAAHQFGAETATVHSNAEVFHGPVIFADGIRFGWFYARTDNALSFSDAEINALLTSILPQGVGQMMMLGEFGGGYKADWRTDVISYQDEDNDFLVAGLDVHSRGRFDSLDSAGTFSSGDISARLNTDVELSSTPIYGDVEVEFIAPQVPLTSIRMQVDAINVAIADGSKNIIKNVLLQQQQRLENDKINSKMRFSVDSVEGAFPLNDVYYEMELKQVSQAAMAAWAELSPKLQAEDAFSAHEQELRDALALLLSKDLSLSTALGGKAMGGYLTTKLDLEYVPPSDGRPLETLSSTEDYIALIKGSGQIIISKEIIEGSALQFLLAPYLDVYIVQQGDEYVVNARINDGKLWIGDSVIDLAPWVEMYLAAVTAQL